MSPKELPILFRSDMVNAILEGRKTQTRRLKTMVQPGDLLWVKDTQIELRVKSVERQHLQDISWHGIKSEGVTCQEDGLLALREAWIKLWDSINGKKPGCEWKDNPMVYVITFERIKP